MEEASTSGSDRVAVAETEKANRGKKECPLKTKLVF